MRPPTRAGWGSRAGSSWLQGDWAEGLVETFDLILCNPPYVAEGAELARASREYEPDEALFAGEEGLDAYRALAPQLPRLLESGGLAAVEIGLDQADAVTALLSPRRPRRRRSPTTSADARARSANLGLNEIAWHRAFGDTTSGVRTGPAPLEKLSALRSTPDAIGRSFRARCADRNERVRSRAYRRRPCLPEAKGAKHHCVRT